MLSTQRKIYILQSVATKEEYENFCKKIDSVDAYPNNVNSNIDEGLNDAIDLFDENSNGRKVIVLFSDGIDDIHSDIVDRLLEDNIELHCISIAGEDEKLRQLVNYQQDSHKYDDRLTSVTFDNLNELYDKFIETFFGLKGDVRYKKVELDSNYSYSFSMPELAVSKFQLYIGGGTDILPELYEISNSSVQKVDWEKWGDFKNCIFRTVRDPGKNHIL